MNNRNSRATSAGRESLLVEQNEKRRAHSAGFTRRALSRNAFTLIEMLVVIAITVILLGLIFGPVLEGFNLTNRARVQVQAQDTARSTLEQIQRDMSNGVFIFDDIPQAGQLVPGEFAQPNSISLWLPSQSGALQRELVPYGMVDMVPPSLQNDQNGNVADNAIDPTTGLPIKRGNVALPVAPGRVMVRYWLGLGNNTSTKGGPITRTGIQSPAAPYSNLNGWPQLPYANYYENPQESSPTQMQESYHNPMVLFRAEFSPYLPNLDAGGNAQVDKRLFNLDGGGNPVIYDPNFYYDNTEAQPVLLANGTTTNKVPGWVDENGDGKVNVCENWHAIARAMVPPDRADEITLERDSTRNIVYDATTQLPRPTAQVRFEPTYLGNDAGAPTSATDFANEAINLAPSSYREQYGHWTLPYRVYDFINPLTDTLLNYYFYSGDVIDEGANLRLDIRAQVYDKTLGQVAQDNPVTMDVLKVPYLHGRLMLAAGSRPAVMFTVDDRRGEANFSFPDWAVMHDGAGNPFATTFDPAEPNLYFSTNGTYRLISLGSLNPALNPPLTSGMQSPFNLQGDGTTYIPGVRIVPGSEIVRGPDMLPGPHYGQVITYTRVPRNTDPLKTGANEYMINYENQGAGGGGGAPTIDLRAGTILFRSTPNAPGLGESNDLPINSYGATGILNAPAAPVQVTYQFQNNRASDVVKADYLTRQLMTISLGVRLYEFHSGQPQQVSLTQKVQVRNLQR